MHQQIRTSPGSTDDNMRRVIEALADAEINVEGIGPDFEAPHIRVFIDHDPDDEAPVKQAFDALLHAGLQPVMRRAVTIPMPNSPGAVRAHMRKLVRRGFDIQSVLVLATHDGDLVRVSFGVSENLGAGWEDASHALAELEPDSGD